MDRGACGLPGAAVRWTEGPFSAGKWNHEENHGEDHLAQPVALGGTLQVHPCWSASL